VESSPKSRKKIKKWQPNHVQGNHLEEQTGKQRRRDDLQGLGKAPVRQDLMSSTARAMEEGRAQLLSQATAGEIFTFQALCAQEDEMITSMAALPDPDTMHFHQAMQDPDAPQFLEAAQEEFQKHTDDGTLEIISLSDFPEGFRLFPAAWAMKRKRKVRTREMYKRKARLNFNGSKQKKEDYNQTFAPVASWESVLILLVLALQNGWHAIRLHCVLVFPQAPVDWECYMQIPKGIKIDRPGKWALQVQKNSCGQKQAGRVWNQHLAEKLVTKVGFKQSEHDECAFYRGTSCMHCAPMTPSSLVQTRKNFNKSLPTSRRQDWMQRKKETLKISLESTSVRLQI